MKKSLPLVSFVIPTLNAQTTLERCIYAIRSQKYPKNKIEIIIADAGSTDSTLKIARKWKTKILFNKKLFPEIGKDIGAKSAKGDIIFFTDSDNILANTTWLINMTKPYLADMGVTGFLPQTVPPPDSPGLNRYLGYLFTEPFTWFVYGSSANPMDYASIYKPIYKNDDFEVYTFPKDNFPLFGLAQGVGTIKTFRRNSEGISDDMLSGIQLTNEGGRIAYVPNAKVYHYHIDGFTKYIRKYTWRVRNNLKQQFAGAGIVHRIKYFTFSRKIRMYMFVPYSFSILFPLLDSVRLSIKFHDPVMLFHLPACIVMSCIIVVEFIRHFLGDKKVIGHYE